MKRIICLIILFFVCCLLIALSNICGIWWLSLIGTLSEMLLGCIFSIAFDYILTSGNRFKMVLQSLKYYNKEIRLSFSYLFCIEIEGKYLLVKGNRLKSQYQPIGGVYKYYPEAIPTLEGFEYRSDVRMGNNTETDDLRIKIKGKYLLKYMNWFLSMENREYDPYREFKEELLDSGLLSEECFRTLKYRKILVHNSGVQFSKYLQCNELVYADIFKLILDKKQTEIIKEAVQRFPEQLCLASDDELISECYNGLQKNLGNNAKWLIGGE